MTFYSEVVLPKVQKLGSQQAGVETSESPGHRRYVDLQASRRPPTRASQTFAIIRNRAFL